MPHHRMPPGTRISPATAASPNTGSSAGAQRSRPPRRISGSARDEATPVIWNSIVSTPDCASPRPYEMAIGASQVSST